MRVLCGGVLACVTASALGRQSNSAAPTATTVPPSAVPGLKYDAEFFPSFKHDPGVPTPDSVLGFRLGDRPVMHAQVEAVLKAIAAKSPRCRLFEYGRTHEGRTLYYLAISSEENIKNLDGIKASAAKLADPRTTTLAEADGLVESMPAIAWMAYVIHGDEMSGTDAALALAWHLASCTDDAVRKQLSELVVLIDPLMNPDGRDRCITLINQNRTNAPSVDDQSIIHAEAWPGGRMNHYLFDMNRDWIFGTQPETRGRIAAVHEWHPHYFMESHEQESQDTFLFMPPREPVNPALSPNVRRWEQAFADDLGKAFDAHGWRYYNGEWNEGWYPGYSGSWAATQGMVDNLYEQARIESDGVRRGEGTIETYRESVHKQLVSSLANLTTLQLNHREVLRGYVADRRENVSAEGPLARRSYLIAKDLTNLWRVDGLMGLLALQGIESAAINTDVTFSGRDWLGRPFKDRTWKATDQVIYVIPARQPLGRLAATLLDLDPRMPAQFVTDERRELLRLGQSKLYDITGWNIAMLAGVEVYEIDSPLPDNVQPRVREAGGGREHMTRTVPGLIAAGEQAVAYVSPGQDDRSVALAARLMERGVRVRVVDKATVLDGSPVARGSVFVTRKDNQDFAGDLKKVLADAAAELGVDVRPVVSGMGPGDNPDLGGQHFFLLHQPRIAVLTRDPFNPYTAGEIWHVIDQEMGIRASYINSEMAGGVDLRRYNVLVIPDGGPEIAAKMMENLKPWVEAGGTLVAIGSSCSAITKDKEGIGSTRLLGDVLTKRDDYRVAIIRDWLGKTWTVDPATSWSQTVPAKIEYPWAIDGDTPSEDEAKRRDAWRAIFMPQGAVLAARTDDRSWMTAGAGEVLPVLYQGGTVLIPSSGMNAPVLMGAIVKESEQAAASGEPGKAGSPQAEMKPDSMQKDSAKPDEPKKEPDKASTDKKDGEKKDSDSKDDKKEDKKDDKKKDEPKPGWTVAPPGYELRLRMSGLLWPEAADRIAHSAYVTREGVGAGQVILFACSPTFRDATQGTKRVFVNAIICGPGMGASQAIRP